MNERLYQYFIELYYDIPMGLYEGLLSFLSVGVVVIFVVYGLSNGWRKVALLALAEYVFLTFCSTVIYRPYSVEYGYEFMPFWSYQMIEKDGRYDLIADNIMNVAMFVPVGLLLGCGFRFMTWRKTLIIVTVMSVLIELLQLSLNRGFSEVDDVMHNTTGCMIGYWIYLLFHCLYLKFLRTKSNLSCLDVS